MTSDHRAKPTDLELVAGNYHEYRTCLPIEDVLHDQFFIPLRGQLYPGDKICITQFDSMGEIRKRKLIAHAEVRVIESSMTASEVPLMLTGMYRPEQDKPVTDKPDTQAMPARSAEDVRQEELLKRALANKAKQVA